MNHIAKCIKCHRTRPTRYGHCDDCLPEALKDTLTIIQAQPLNPIPIDTGRGQLDKVIKGLRQSSKNETLPFHTKTDTEHHTDNTPPAA